MYFVSTILSLVCIWHMAHGWGQAERDQILKMHNDYRRGTVKDKGACHMNKIEYDTDMEKAAEAYAKQCVYKHKFDEYGENFAYDSATSTGNAALIKSAVDAWYGEIKDYHYGQNACGDSNTCHYTQIIAASAKKIGCYGHVCPNLVGAAPNVWFFVCYYTPKGNWMGEDSYPKNCDKPCKEGQTEENGLCVGDAEGEGEEKFVCEDATQYCRVWKQNGQCEMNPKYMNKKCPVTCGKCVPEGGVPAVDNCIDNDPRCDMFAKQGQCQKRPTDMNKRCPKACKKC